MGNVANFTTLSPTDNLHRYLQEIRRFPMLEPNEEYMLAKRWREHDDTESAHRMVTSHLRLVAKIASGYKGYGLPQAELISEGNIGLMQAVKRFDPERGFRLATYAMWWIRAAIQEYILHSWSLVKIGTTAAQKKLFFNLRKIKKQIAAIEEGDLTPEHTTEIADRLQVSEQEVVTMNRRMSGNDYSLNAPIRNDDDGESEWMDWLQSDEEGQEDRLAKHDELAMRSRLLHEAMATLNERERDIITQRRLDEDPKTLDQLSQVYGVSRERVRQIEVAAFEKLQSAMRDATKRMLPSPTA